MEKCGGRLFRKMSWSTLHYQHRSRSAVNCCHSKLIANVFSQSPLFSIPLPTFPNTWPPTLFHTHLTPPSTQLIVSSTPPVSPHHSNFCPHLPSPPPTPQHTSHTFSHLPHTLSHTHPIHSLLTLPIPQHFCSIITYYSVLLHSPSTPLPHLPAHPHTSPNTFFTSPHTPTHFPIPFPSPQHTFPYLSPHPNTLFHTSPLVSPHTPTHFLISPHTLPHTSTHTISHTLHTLSHTLSLNSSFYTPTHFFPILLHIIPY